MCLFVICASAAGAAPTTDPVAEARAALDRAVSVRRDAETRSDQVHQQLAEHEANLARQVGADTDAARRMEQARAQMQRSATAALIGDDDVATAMDWLSPGPAMERSARAVYPAHRAEQFADATAVYRAARARLAPELRKLADEIAQLRSEVAQADAAAIQAAALERDAERHLDEAAQAARAQAAADRAKAASDAAQRAAARRVVATPAAGAPSDASLPAAPTGGPSEAQWARLRQCESGGNYRAVNPSGKYRGAYQFDYRTWAAMGGSGDPAAASPAEQDLRAKMLYDLRGWRPWPECGRFLR